MYRPKDDFYNIEDTPPLDEEIDFDETLFIEEDEEDDDE